MIPFERSFFRGEQRDDYYVEPMMKCCWAAEMEVLAEINQICINHDLHWFADWGTLLGAARHQGFVPWDDDMDICMLRGDYNKFIHFAQTELPAGFWLASPYTVDTWNQPHCLVRNSTEITLSLERLAAFHGCPYCVGVDIFPLDALPPEPEGSAIRALADSIFCLGKRTDNELADVMDFLPELEEMCHIKFDTSHNLKNQLFRAADKVCQYYDISESDYVTNYLTDATKEYPMRKEWYLESIRLPFENITVYAPKEYDKVLTVQYGDWRTPVKTLQHPFYEGQRQELNAEIAKRIMQGESIF